ncbi:unnamed protein product [Cladocopium goreaui]|uniref:Uncharacterized protein n=1 Tax=Cladocopium goreaui TaxID=2562237 RepID=A0A9P1DX20_9DINO|nr:unnamed protein product [Cladocopium goreaui]
MLMVTVVFLLQNFHDLDEGYYHADGQRRGDKLQHALIVLTPSILGGAITTIAACAFLLPCRMILFRKLGWTLMLNAAISIIYTFSFLAPLLLIAGPMGTCCATGRDSRSVVPEVFWLEMDGKLGVVPNAFTSLALDQGQEMCQTTGSIHCVVKIKHPFFDFAKGKDLEPTLVLKRSSENSRELCFVYGNATDNSYSHG